MGATEHTGTEQVVLSKQEHDRLMYMASKYAEIGPQYEDLKFQLAQLKRIIFGSKSEKFLPTNDAQLAMFQEQDTKEEEPSEQISYTRKKTGIDKKQPVRTALPAHLPRLKEVIEPDPIPEGAKKIGDEVSEHLEFKPAKMFVRQIIRPKYAVKERGILCAEMPTMPLPRSNAGAGLLAHLMVSKFVDHLPFYRQNKMFLREGIRLSESTIGGWFSNSCDLMELLYQKMKVQLLACGYVQADETPIKVLDSTKKKSSHRGYHWVYHDPVNRTVIFDYRKGRSREGPNRFLKNYSGILQTDGYTVYDDLTIKQNIIHAGCMAHVRRKFFDAKDSDPERCKHALKLIKVLYMMEEFSRQNNHDDQEVLRQRQAAWKVFDELKVWLDKHVLQVRPKSPAGKAIAYTLNQWPKLLVYTQYPQMKIDNNLIENTIRPVALGRKNYLFGGSHHGAQRAAMIYSFRGTCKLNDINPWQWLNHVLSVIPDQKTNQLHELFPQNCQLTKQ